MIFVQPGCFFSLIFEWFFPRYLGVTVDAGLLRTVFPLQRSLTSVPLWPVAAKWAPSWTPKQLSDCVSTQRLCYLNITLTKIRFQVHNWSVPPQGGGCIFFLESFLLLQNNLLFDLNWCSDFEAVSLRGRSGKRSVGLRQITGCITMWKYVHVF